MQHRFLLFTAAAVLATGTVWAQAPAADPPANGATAVQPRLFGRFGRLVRLARSLNLTDSQKQQAKAIFQQARQSGQSIRLQLQQNRQALRQAAENGGDIQPLATQQGVLLGQMVAIRTQAWGQFYSLLTPDQRAQVNQRP